MSLGVNMIEFNKTIKTTSEVCLQDNGVFCQEWQIDTEITHPLATLIILGQFALFILVIKWIRRL